MIGLGLLGESRADFWPEKIARALLARQDAGADMRHL